MRSILAAFVLFSGTVTTAAAQSSQQAPAMQMPPASTATPWSQANAEAMQRMSAAMTASAGGASEDEAFVRGMLPHHQGAVDMAHIELQYGHDPELKRLAARIVATQQAEIREMSAWLARHR